MISVIMGVYNAEKTVLRAAESILVEQEELELILIDDASTDGTPDVLGALKERDARVLLLRNDQNRGLAYSLNAGLHVARGEFIARMDADDFSHAGRLAAQKKFLEENPSYAFVGSAANLAEQGKIYGRRSFPAAPDEKELIRRCPFIHPSLMFRAEALKRVGGYRDAKFTYRCEDYDLYFRLYKQKLIGYNIRDALIDYEEKRGDASKHTAKTRLNEFKVRVEGSLSLGKPLGALIAFRCLLLMVMPKKMYIKLKNKKAEKVADADNQV